jgi:hypothetical protein
VRQKIGRNLQDVFFSHVTIKFLKLTKSKFVIKLKLIM